MAQGFFITGTDTDIGKTYAAVKLIHRWRAQGHTVAAMKPVAAGCYQGPDGGWYNDDVQRLMAATGQTDLALMNPYCFLPFDSPHIAAQAAGVTISLARIRAHYERLCTDHDRVVVEGAGGWFTPLSEQLTIRDLACTLGLPVILVVGMRLGCLNHALLTVQAIESSGLPLAGWVANSVDAAPFAYEANLATLKARIPAPLMSAFPYTGQG